jgi:hypothetical protein
VNIVKEFEDHEFFRHPMMSSPEFHNQYTWYWGLEEGGEIYYRCTRFSDPDEWRRLTNNRDIAVLIGLKTMKKLVKQFGHLLVFT